VTNPPSHSPKQTLIEFIEGAKQRLKKGGKLYVVTERWLAPAIERDCKRVLGNYQVVASEGGYVVSVGEVED